jgi:hypothetical protein
LGGKKVASCLVVFIVATVLLCVELLGEESWVYMSTLCLITAVGGNLAGMGIHAFGKKKVS